MKAFIDDGYNITAGLNEIPGMVPAVEFTYRPFCGKERMEFGVKYYAAGNDRGVMALEMLDDRLINWDLEDSEGKTEPSMRLIKKLNANLLERLIETIMGTQSADYLVDETTEEADAKN